MYMVYNITKNIYIYFAQIYNDNLTRVIGRSKIGLERLENYDM